MRPLKIAVQVNRRRQYDEASDALDKSADWRALATLEL